MTLTKRIQRCVTVLPFLEEHLQALNIFLVRHLVIDLQDKSSYNADESFGSDYDWRLGVN